MNKTKIILVIITLIIFTFIIVCYFNFILDCCCSKLEEVLKCFERQEDKQKKRDEKILTHLLMINGVNARLSSALQNNCKKLDAILAADSRVRALAMPTPKLPSPFMDLLPINTIENLETVESLICQSSPDMLTSREELVTMIFMFFKSILYINLNN